MEAGTSVYEVMAIDPSDETSVDIDATAVFSAGGDAATSYLSITVETAQSN